MKCLVVPGEAGSCDIRRRRRHPASARRGTLLLAAKNTGNTIDPIGGRVKIGGHGHTLSGIVSPQAILPGATVNLRLTRLRGSLPRGNYRVGVALTQAGHRVGGLRRGISLR